MTAVAVVFAVAAAVLFGVAAVTQHRAVRRAVAPTRRRLRLGQIAVLLADSGWRRGLGLMTAGTALHVTALSLAPISLTQPANVLAVPTAVLAAAAFRRRRPLGSLLLAATAVVLGVAGFVAALSGGSAGDLPSPALLGGAAAVIIAVTGLLHGAARLLTGGHGRRTAGAPRWLPPVLLGIAGAVNFGVASTTFRLLAQELGHTWQLTLPATAVLLCAVPTTLALGSWSLHQAYAAGAAAAVTATSALIDPLVAVTLGVAVLGETHQFTAARLSVMVVAAVLAGAGIVHLAHHDDKAPDLSPTPAVGPKDQPCASSSPLTSTPSTPTGPALSPSVSPPASPAAVTS